MIVIKRASEADAQILTELAKSTFIETFAHDNRSEDVELYVAETFSFERQLSEIRDPKRRIEIAWLETKPVGFLHLIDSRPDPSVIGSRPIEVLRLYVDSRWHGKGVGAALLERCVQLARQEGFQTLWLGVWERNVKAQAFYKKHGFSVVGQHLFRLGTDDQLDLVMVRYLPGDA